jgi:hypothetical protein
VTLCSAADPADAIPPPGPFISPHYHFGMLLGVDDFDTEQGYHRGKIRLHNAWLHGAGVVWGYQVTADMTAGEVRVGPGLALDGAGRELYLDGEYCVNVGRWYAKNQKDLPADPTKPFDLCLVARFKPCLTRQVPAVAEPCQGSFRDTAYSRLVETVDLYLRLVKPTDPPPPAPPFHRLRAVLGLDPFTDDDKKALGDLVKNAGTDTAARLAVLRRFTVQDVTDRGPAKAQSGEPVPLFPETDAAEVLLANVTGVALAKDGDGWKLATATVDESVRSVLLPTAALQDLLVGRALGGTGPRVSAVAQGADNKSLTFTTDRDLLAATLTPDSVSVTYLDVSGANNTPGKWGANVVKPTITFDQPTRTATVSLTAAFPAKGLVRLIVRGTGPAPVVGADLAPLAGPGSTPPTANDGADFVFTARRT